VAIEIVLPDSGRVELTDTFRPRGRALNGLGDSVQAQLYWSTLDTAIIVVLDSTTGVTLPKVVGSGRLQARTGRLFSNPQTVAVLARLDSMYAGGPTRDTLVVTPTPSTYPGSGPVITLLPRDTVSTATDGTAATQVRLHTGTLPDSVVVTATMRKFHGAPLPGSPVRFVVVFRP
jgi:hypothetical protein